MSAPVNLNRARKVRARAEKTKQADENAVRFGRNKAERAAQDQRDALDARRLDGHKLSPEE